MESLAAVAGGQPKWSRDLGPLASRRHLRAKRGECVITGDPTPEPVTQELPTRFGFMIAGPGDVDGDGLADLVVGAPSIYGSVHVIFGSDAPLRGTHGVLDLENLGEATRFTNLQQIIGFGETLAAPGDVNGDGMADFVIGAPGGGDFNGESWIVFGGPHLRSERAYDVRGGEEWITKLTGEYSYDYAGFLSDLGDVNQDGLADFAVVATNLVSEAARAYVVFGRREFPRVIELALLGDQGFTIRGRDEHFFSAG